MHLFWHVHISGKNVLLEQLDSWSAFLRACLMQKGWSTLNVSSWAHMIECECLETTKLRQVAWYKRAQAYNAPMDHWITIHQWPIIGCLSLWIYLLRSMLESLSISLLLSGFMDRSPCLSMPLQIGLYRQTLVEHQKDQHNRKLTCHPRTSQLLPSTSTANQDHWSRETMATTLAKLWSYLICKHAPRI